MGDRNNLSGVNRTVARVLAFVWMATGAAAAVVGFSRGRPLIVIVAVAAIAYGLVWLRVASRSRLLSWRELISRDDR